MVTATRGYRRQRVERRTWRPLTFGPGMIVGLVAAAAVVVSLFLPWRSGGVNPSEIPAAFLWDRGSASSDPSLLIFLIPLAVVLVLGAVVWHGELARVFAGLGILVVAGVFAYQLDRVGNTVGAQLGDLLDSGFYVAAIGGFLAWASAMLPDSWGPRQEVTETGYADEAVTQEPAEPRHDSTTRPLRDGGAASPAVSNRTDRSGV